jgi:hypothetical protein
MTDHSGHPDAEDFALYVIDGLPPDQAAALEAHVGGCGECAARLGAEARLELLLDEVAAAPRPLTPALARRMRGWRWAVAGGLSAAAAAAAAAALLWLGRPPPVPPPDLPVAVVAPPQVVTCLEAADEAACVAEARGAGLMPALAEVTPARFDQGDDHSARMDTEGDDR